MIDCISRYLYFIHLAMKFRGVVMGFSILMIAVCVILSIIIHLYVLRLLWRFGRPQSGSMSGLRIAILVIGCVIGHLLEIALFAIGLVVVANVDGDNQSILAGYHHEHLDAWYYSAAFYTSLGDNRPPTSSLRIFAACEALTGLILITWTASFLFLLMQRSWEADRPLSPGC